MYDQKCYDLAAAFLDDYPQLANAGNCAQLAKQIQRVIEDFIAELGA